MDKVKIFNSLLTKGFYLTSVANHIEFTNLCSSIGDVLKYTDVRIDKDKPWYLNKPDEFPLHSDDPDINIIAWKCVKQDDIYGDSLIVDSRKILSSLSEKFLNALTTIHINISISSRISPLLISKEPEKLYFAPWNIDKDTLSPIQKEALKLFQQKIDNANRTVLRLKDNDVLIVNNNFMLHGRESIPSHSSRHLIRSLINSQQLQRT